MTKSNANTKKIGKVLCTWDGSLEKPGDEIQITFSLKGIKSVGSLKLELSENGDKKYFAKGEFLTVKKEITKESHAIAFLATNFACEVQRQIMDVYPVYDNNIH